MRNYYPDELRKIASLLDKLNEADKEDDHGTVSVKNGVVVVDLDEPDRPLGTLVDEIGGSWSFRPSAEATS